MESDTIRQLKEVVEAAMHLSEAMAAISFAAGDARETLERTQTISAATEEMVATVNEISRATNDCAAMARECEHESAESVSTLRSAVESMRLIHGASETGMERTSRLESASVEIGDIVRTIQEIANQTNLLALNATIEASRAGEAGRGFAVVASEVKELSKQTASATEGIRRCVEGLQAEIAGIAEAMRAMREAVGNGETLVEEASQRVDAIGDRVRQLSEMLGTTASSVTEQTSANQEIACRISEIAELANHAASNTETAIEAVAGEQAFIDRQLEAFDALEIPGYAIFRSQVDHFLWKKKLAEYLLGRNEDFLQQLRDHHQCRLGKWYDSVSSNPRYKNLPEFAALEAVHASVHSHGIEAARRFREGDRKGAMESYAALDVASRQVVDLLRKLAVKLGFDRAGNA